MFGDKEFYEFNDFRVLSVRLTHKPIKLIILLNS